MTKRLNDLRHQRSQLVDQARGILAKAETEKRGLTAEEQGQYDKIFADQEQLRGTIEAEQRQIELERSLAGTQLNEQRANDGNQDDGPDGAGRDSKAYRAAFRSLLLNGRSGLTGDQVRALSADVSPQGGYTVAPALFVDTLLKFVDDEVFIRRYATKYKVAGYSSLGAPSLDNDPADADWTSEIATGAEDSTMSFGKREMVPSPLAKRLKVSNKLLNNSNMDVGTLVATRLAYKFGITQEKAFLIGSGSSQPLGVFTAHNSGIPTTRDISTGNTTTGMTFDGLVSAKYALKPAH